MTEDECRALEHRRTHLLRELEERKRNLPAHTVRPHQILLIEELEEEIGRIGSRLAEVEK